MEFHPLRAELPVAVDLLAKESKASAAAAMVDADDVIPSADAKPWRQHPGTPSRAGQQLSALNAEQIAAFDRDGFLVIKAQDAWMPEQLEALINNVKDIQTWPDRAGKWMKYYENSRHDASQKLLCRIENFVPYNKTMSELLQEGSLLNMSSELFGEQAVMYKDKINMKMPGGDGFAPHQDVAAGWWMYGQSLHLSCLVSIDHATRANGCLEVVAGQHKRGMLSEEWKEMAPEVINDPCMKWEFLETEPGDVVFFDSYVPHRSAPNNTAAPRRIVYTTYAKASEGDLRERYYADKRAAFPPDCEREAGKEYKYKI